MLNISQTASHEITLVHLSVCPSIRLSLSFQYIGLIVFSHIVYDDSWRWYLLTDGARFSKKKICGPNLDPSSQTGVQKRVFYHFPKWDSLVFLEIACNDGLQQCLTPSRGKIHEKKFEIQIWAKRAKIIHLKLLFLSFSQVWFISFPWNSIQWKLATMYNIY